MGAKVDAKRDKDTAIVNLKRVRFQAQFLLTMLDREFRPWDQDTVVLGWPGPANGGQPWPEDPVGRKVDKP